MPLNIHGSESSARTVLRLVRALPLLDGVLQRLGVSVSVVPGNVRRTVPAAACMQSVGCRSHDPLMFARLEVSPHMCAAHDRGEAGMGVRAWLSGATALLLARHVPQSLREEAAGVVLADGAGALAAIRAAAGAGGQEAATVLEQLGRLSARQSGDRRWDLACADEAVRPLFADAAPGSPAPHVWPGYWFTALRIAAAAPSAPMAGDGVVMDFVTAHMAYNGEMYSGDRRWSLPRRLLNAAADALLVCSWERAAAFGHVLSAIRAAAPTAADTLRHGLDEAVNSGDPDLSDGAAAIRLNIAGFCPSSIAAGADGLAAPAMALLAERLGGRDAALAAVRDASLHIVHVAAMTKTCFPADASQRSALMCALAERPRLGDTLVRMAEGPKLPGARTQDSEAATQAARQASAACDYYEAELDRARENIGIPRTAALTRVDRAVEACGDRQAFRLSRKPVDLLHMTISVSARAAVLGVPAAWPDIEAGTVASISGFGRTGDRQAFMAAAGAMRAGMDHRIAIERDAAFTQAAKAALSAVGLAYGRVVESLQAGTRDESRYATLAQDLADIRDRLGSLPDGLAGPIADAVTAGLCHGAGTREYNGFTMRADGRLLLPGEADAGDACAAWLHAAAAAAPGQDAERLLAAAGQISAAASRARAAGEPGTALRR